MWVTPEQFAKLLDAEAVGREPAGDVTAPFLGVPRDRCESEYLSKLHLRCLNLKRAGHSLKAIANDAMVRKSTERVRQILFLCVRMCLEQNLECRKYHCWRATMCTKRSDWNQVNHRCSRRKKT